MGNIFTKFCLDKVHLQGWTKLCISPSPGLWYYPKWLCNILCMSSDTPLWTWSELRAEQFLLVYLLVTATGLEQIRTKGVFISFDFPNPSRTLRQGFDLDDCKRGGSVQEIVTDASLAAPGIILTCMESPRTPGSDVVWRMWIGRELTLLSGGTASPWRSREQEDLST